MLNGIDQERVIEYQRGVCLFGYPFFSEKLLVPGYDPPRFLAMIGNEEDGFKSLPVMIPHGKRGNSNTKNLRKMIPLPFEGDENKAVRSRMRSTRSANTAENGLEESRDYHPHYPRDGEEWYVMMEHGVSDVDDQGWMYSWSFKSRQWKGRYGFVRKRIWIRLPSTTPELVQIHDLGSRRERMESQQSHIEEEMQQDETQDAVVDRNTALPEPNEKTDALINELKTCTLDRKRFELLNEVLHSWTKYDLMELTKEPILSSILGTFQFETSRERFRNEILDGLAT
ncbi:hypothetical protein C6P41_001314 [Kluyveromyces marxianus]|nr:hypothetical protein C6P43_004151 [Kluyveromyces marxianus]KAG0684954.1 hypothetical protein C6P41_001314 [Kluyveromyces marxianus]